MILLFFSFYLAILMIFRLTIRIFTIYIVLINSCWFLCLIRLKRSRERETGSCYHLCFINVLFVLDLILYFSQFLSIFLWSGPEGRETLISYQLKAGLRFSALIRDLKFEFLVLEKVLLEVSNSEMSLAMSILKFVETSIRISNTTNSKNNTNCNWMGQRTWSPCRELKAS